MRAGGTVGWKKIKSVGGYGHKVAVMRRDASPNLYLRWGADSWESLGHSDLGDATIAARRRSAALLAAQGSAGGRTPTLAELFTLYELQVTPSKKPVQRKEDKRRIALWTYVLGPSFAPLKLTGAQLKAFERARRAGTLHVPGRKLREARAKTVREDLAFLKAVLSWAASMTSGWLLERNPMTGYALPREINRRTPRAYWEDYLELQKVARAVDPLFGPFMALVESLGWRVSAICQLRPSDFDPVRTKTRPHGRLLKRAESDKVGVERWTVISADTRTALEELLQLTGRVGHHWFFSAKKSKGEPWSRHYARDLLRRAWEAAKVPEERRTGFHGFRRKWVDERKHLSDADVAAQGAWLDPRTLKIYQQPDEETLLAVAEAPHKLRFGATP
jgi:integrase